MEDSFQGDQRGGDPITRGSEGGCSGRVLLVQAGHGGESDVVMWRRRERIVEGKKERGEKMRGNGNIGNRGKYLQE